MKTAKINRLSANNSIESCGLFAQKKQFQTDN
jgi:hypothetical protein